MNNSKDCFTLKSTSADFAQRQKNVFDQLKVLENNRKNTSSEENQMEVDQQHDSNRRMQRSVTKHFRGKESIFKKPNNPVPKNFVSRIPDFKKHPHKWTKYSLDDVREEDMSDKGNTKAALSFLKELEERKNSEIDCSDEKVAELPTRIIFKKHTSAAGYSKESKEDPEESKPSFRSSKVIMPEYVVGQKSKKDKKNKAIKAGKGKELKLDHLLEDEDGE